MSCFYQSYRNMLVLKCDGCGITEDLYEWETDRLLANDWIKEHGWKTMKQGSRWINICPRCKKAFEDARRDHWIKERFK